MALHVTELAGMTATAYMGNHTIEGLRILHSGLGDETLLTDALRPFLLAQEHPHSILRYSKVIHIPRYHS
jgi:hypothetical protein